jgi:hypothetical protein
MKKLLIAMFVLCIGVSTMAGAAASDEYSAMDLGIWFGLPTSMKTANIRGFRLGLPISSGDGYVSGFEYALFCAATDDIEGLQMSCVAVADKVSGAQISAVNVCDKKLQGTQFGVVNVAGERGWQFGLINSSNNAKFQFGLINMNEDGLWPFSFLVNFGKDSFKSSETIVKEAAECEKKKKKK